MKNFFSQLSDILAVHKLVITALVISASLLLTAYRWVVPLTQMNNRVTVLERKVVADSIAQAGMQTAIQQLVVGQSEENGMLRVLIARERQK